MSEISRSVGVRGINQPNDKMTVKGMLNTFIFAGKLPGVPVLALAELSPGEEQALNRAIRQFQLTYVPRTPDGRVDPNGQTLRTLRKRPQDVGLSKKELKQSYLSGSVGLSTPQVRAKNARRDVAWVQERLNVKMFFGFKNKSMPPRSNPGTTFVPTNGRLKRDKHRDPTIAAIITIQNHILKYDRATGVIEPGDPFDLYLQEVWVPNPTVWLDRHMTKKQQLSHRLYITSISDEWNAGDENDRAIREILRLLLRPTTDDSYLTQGNVEAFIDKKTPTLQTSSLRKYLEGRWTLTNEFEAIKTEKTWVSFLRSTLLAEIWSGSRGLGGSATGITGAVSPERDTVMAWYKYRCDHPRSVYYPLEITEIKHFWN